MDIRAEEKILSSSRGGRSAERGIKTDRHGRIQLKAGLLPFGGPQGYLFYRQPHRLHQHFQDSARQRFGEKGGHRPRGGENGRIRSVSYFPVKARHLARRDPRLCDEEWRERRPAPL